MRIDTKLNALKSVTQSGQFVFNHEYILNGERVKIENWDDVIIALQVLREVDWMGDDRYSRLLDDYLNYRGEGDTLEITNNEFQQLNEAVQRYNSGLEIILNTLRVHTVSSSEDTVWVEIRSATDPAELAKIVNKIERTFNVAGQVDSSFKFVGVAQGSDWLGFVPNSELAGIALNYCIGLAASISTELIKVSGFAMTATARIILRESGDDNPSQEAVDERLRDIKEETMNVMIERGVQEFVEHLAESNHPEDVQNLAAEAIKVATRTITEMATEDRAVFEMSESGRNITIEIHGDNNQITIQNFPEMPRPQEALPSGETESDSEE